jgi:hypothetical protein
LVPVESCVSIRQAPAEVGGEQDVPDRAPSVDAKPTVGYAELYEISAVFKVRIDATEDDSFAAMRARNRLGIAIAAIIKMIATTMSNSMSEKPVSACPRVTFPS